MGWVVLVDWAASVSVVLVKVEMLEPLLHRRNPSLTSSLLMPVSKTPLVLLQQEVLELLVLVRDKLLQTHLQRSLAVEGLVEREVLVVLEQEALLAIHLVSTPVCSLDQEVWVPVDHLGVHLHLGILDPQRKFTPRNWDN